VDLAGDGRDRGPDHKRRSLHLRVRLVPATQGWTDQFVALEDYFDLTSGLAGLAEWRALKMSKRLMAA
jgi:hypothetical protein